MDITLTLPSFIDTFGATALSSYGGFWISYAMIQTGGFGIAAAYGDDKAALMSALGFYLIAYVNPNPIMPKLYTKTNVISSTITVGLSSQHCS